MPGSRPIAANGNYDYPNTSDREVTTRAFQLVNDAALAGATFTLQAKVMGAPDTAYDEIPYKRRNLLGTVSDDTIVSAVLGLGFIIQVDCAGMDLRFVVASRTSGSATLYDLGVVG